MLPARRTSKSVKRARRSHHALKAVNVSACPQCGQAKLPHRACMNCGYVSPKVSIKIKSEE
ncbi:MAG: 50S ribosomal protein L32 [Planctomycetota bacterium]|nr:50S ribosomal protein L32 [Planctomycetota bacterium]MCZ6699224.1 50S ribosomal protein L32 [Planctomycetota bacterium]MCZ6815864.1 50S ribosomal protein L32 [Planctomycetota bacterium]